MEANELRLGNLCEYFIQDNVEKDYWVKNKIDIQDLELCLKEKEYFNKLYRPIPLTDEVLEKCGLKKSKGQYAGAMWIKPKESRIFNLYPHDSYYRYTNCKAIGATPEIYHLHQLQNLYFALTGQELIVNL
jgi:hypothetical protein